MAFCLSLLMNGGRKAGGGREIWSDVLAYTQNLAQRPVNVCQTHRKNLLCRSRTRLYMIDPTRQKTGLDSAVVLGPHIGTISDLDTNLKCPMGR